jgi:hypothetical protein
MKYAWNTSILIYFKITRKQSTKIYDIYTLFPLTISCLKDENAPMALHPHSQNGITVLIRSPDVHEQRPWYSGINLVWICIWTNWKPVIYDISRIYCQSPYLFIFGIPYMEILGVPDRKFHECTSSGSPRAMLWICSPYTNCRLPSYHSLYTENLMMVVFDIIL